MPSNEFDFNKKEKALVGRLIKEYHRPDGIWGWHIPDLCGIAKKLDNKFYETVSYIRETIDTFEPEEEHFAGAYYLAAREQNRPKTKKQVAEAFGINLESLDEGIKSAEQAQTRLRQMQCSPA